MKLVILANGNKELVLEDADLPLLLAAYDADQVVKARKSSRRSMTERGLRHGGRKAKKGARA